VKLDPALLDHLRSNLGPKALPTLEEAYENLCDLAREWRVELTGPLSGATCSLVLAGQRGGDEVVLRAPLLDWERSASLPALRAFSGHGGVSILSADDATGATLMPRLQPGNTLDLHEEAAVEVCIDLIRRLRGATGSAQGLEGYFEGLDNQPTFGAREGFVEDVRRLARHLLGTSPPPRLLHGDLHHFNILRHGDDCVIRSRNSPTAPN
jgi:streptomycin 6-kinase